MKLLIVTQAVDRHHPVLGFFHHWIEEFSRQCDAVTVLCLERGAYHLPESVRVVSLGKDEGKSKAVWLWRLLRESVRRRHAYDAVFVHMNPEYVVYAGWLWRILGKRIVLWYTHKSIPTALRFAPLFAHAIATASSESLRLNTAKKRVVGHGIAMDALTIVTPPPAPPYCLAAVGRIARIKRLDIVVRAVALLKKEGLPVLLTVVGAPLTEDDTRYEKSLRALVEQEGIADSTVWEGGVAHRAALKKMGESHCVLHASETGSLDKVVLEAAAMGVPVISSNDAAIPLLRRAGAPAVPPRAEAAVLAGKAKEVLWYDAKKRAALSHALRERVAAPHTLPGCVKKLVELLFPHGTASKTAGK